MATFATLGIGAWFPAAAQEAPGFWEIASDRFFEVMVDGARTDRLLLHLQELGPLRREVVLSQSSRSGQPLTTVDLVEASQEGVNLRMFLAGIDEVPAGFVLKFTKPENETVMGMRGSLSNCSEMSEQDCRRLGLSDRSDLTLGVVSCLCEREGEVVEIDGKRMFIVPCYIGRAGTYLEWQFGFGPLGAEAVDFLKNAYTTQRRDLCLASSAAQRYPEFLVERVPETPGMPLPQGVDPDLWVSLVVASDPAVLSGNDVLSLAMSLAQDAK